jgi:hypothetical protein
VYSQVLPQQDKAKSASGVEKIADKRWLLSTEMFCVLAWRHHHYPGKTAAGGAEVGGLALIKAGATGLNLALVDVIT